MVAYSTETIKFISSPLYLVRLGLISFISGSSLFLASVCRWVHEAKYNFHYGVVKTKLYNPVITITVVKKYIVVSKEISFYDIKACDKKHLNKDIRYRKLAMKSTKRQTLSYRETENVYVYKPW